MNANLTLEEFPPVSTEQWDEVVRADLKGAAPKSKLFYRAEDLPGTESTTPGLFPFTRGNRTDNNWRIRVAVDTPAAAKVALAGGAEEIAYRLGDQNINDVLTALPNCPVHFEAGPRAAELLAALALKPILSGSVDFDPLAHPADAVSLISTKRTQSFRPVTIRAHRFSEAGSTLVQELAFALAEGVEVLAQLTDHGMTPADAANSLAFSFAIGSAYFMEIAKLRAARTLWARAVSSFGPSGDAARMVLYARTSHWTKTIYDAHVNLLRSTTEAMAAAIGGADALQVGAYNETYRVPDVAAERLARNTQLVLKREAYLDRSVDPAGGSYYLEVLTDSLAREAWKLFQQIEAAGGFLAYRESGALDRDVAKSRADREALVSSRRTSIVGTNQYPNPAEHMLSHIEREDPAPRAASIFEQIRLRTERHAAKTGHTPHFLLLESGDLKMRKARSGFAANFLGCAGFEVEIADAIAGNPDVVVLCSSDPEYAALAPQVIESLRAAGKNTPVIVAGNPAGSEQLKQTGVADFIHLRSNAAEVLRNWQNRLRLGGAGSQPAAASQAAPRQGVLGEKA